jgi:hypothetical protein
LGTLEPNLAPEAANNVWQVASSNLDKIGSTCNTNFLRKQNLESRTMQGKVPHWHPQSSSGLFNVLPVPLPVYCQPPSRLPFLCFSFGATLTMSSMTLFGKGGGGWGGSAEGIFTYSPLLLIRWGASHVQFFNFAMSQFDRPITHKNETTKAPQNKRLYFEV